MDIKQIVLAQYPAVFLLSILFLIGYLRARKRSAVKSVLWVLLFGIALAAAVVLCFLGMQQKYWTLKTLFPLSVWSWIGVGVVVVLELAHIVHSLEKRSSKRRLEKELKRAEEDKEAAVAQARAEGREAALLEAEEAARTAAEAEAAAKAADEASFAETAAELSSLVPPVPEAAEPFAAPPEAPAEPEAPPAEEADGDDEMPKFSLGALFKKD